MDDVGLKASNLYERISNQLQITAGPLKTPDTCAKVFEDPEQERWQEPLS